MSLRALGVYEPLPRKHPAVGVKCWICGRTLKAGTRTALKQWSPRPTKKGWHCVEAKLVCATCHLRGTEVETLDGLKVIETIKDGRCRYPVVMTDGKEYREEDVFPVGS